VVVVVLRLATQELQARTEVLVAEPEEKIAVQQMQEGAEIHLQRLLLVVMVRLLWHIKDLTAVTAACKIRLTQAVGVAEQAVLELLLLPRSQETVALHSFQRSQDQPFTTQEVAGVEVMEFLLV